MIVDPKTMTSFLMKSEKSKLVAGMADITLGDYVYSSNGKVATNYRIIMMNYAKFISEDEKPVYYALYKLERKIASDDDPTESIVRSAYVLVDLSRVNDNKYLDNLFPSEFVTCQCCSDAVRHTLLRRLIIEPLAWIEPQEFYVPKRGYGTVNGIPYYTFGSKTYCLDDSIRFYNDNPSELMEHKEGGNWLKWIIRFVNAKNMEPVLFLAAILPYMFHLIHSDTDDHRFAVYLNGASSVGKTTQVQLLTDIFEDQGNCMSLSSDKKDLINLCRYNGCPTIVEDHKKSVSIRENGNNLYKISDIIGQFQSFGQRTIDGRDATLKSILFVTAEKYIKNPSTANRCLIIEVLGKFDPDEMMWLQENKELLLCFIDEFIMYLLENDADIRRRIEGYNELYKSDGAEYNGYELDLKVAKTKKTLRLTRKVLEDFICHKYHFNQMNDHSDDEIGSLFQKFDESIDRCIRNALKHVSKKAPKEGTEYVDKLAMLFFPQNDNYSVTDCYKLYSKYRVGSKRSNDPNKPRFIGYCDIDEDCICIKSNDLLEYFKQLADFPLKVTLKSMIDQLRYHGILRLRGGESTYALSHSQNNTRFLHIRARELFIWFRNLNEALCETYYPHGYILNYFTEESFCERVSEDDAYYELNLNFDEVDFPGEDSEESDYYDEDE